jgi:hypothetical protein
VKYTVRGAGPELGLADAAATSCEEPAVAEIVRDLLLEALRLSVTVRVAV